MRFFYIETFFFVTFGKHREVPFVVIGLGKDKAVIDMETLFDGEVAYKNSERLP